MNFILSDSPFRNYHKYDRDNIFDFMLPIATRFVETQHEIVDAPIPPSAFVLRGDQGTYLNGYAYKGHDQFSAVLQLEADSADAIITLAEFGSMDNDYSLGLLLLCVQCKAFYTCAAFSLSDGTRHEVLADPLRIQTTPVEDEDGVCHLIGAQSILQSFYHKIK